MPSPTMPTLEVFLLAVALLSAIMTAAATTEGEWGAVAVFAGLIAALVAM